MNNVLNMDPSKFPEDVRKIFQQVAARRATHGEQLGGPYLALFNHPELARRIEELGFYLKFEGTLPRVIYQFVVLCVARMTGAGFEWQDHLDRARTAGVPPGVIDAVAAGQTQTLPQPFALVDAILSRTLRWQSLPLDVQREAVAEWGDRGLLEIVVLSGFYQMFAAVNDAFEIV